MNNNPNQRKRNPFITLVIIFAIVGLVQLLLTGTSRSDSGQKISSSEFLQQLEEGNVKEFEIQVGSGVYEIQGTLNENVRVDESSSNFVQVIRGSDESDRFNTKLLANDSTLDLVTTTAREKGVKFQTVPESSAGLWISMIPMLILTFMSFFILYSVYRQNAQGGGGVMGFGKSSAKDVNKETVQVKFSDVAGLEEEKQELVEVVEFLKDPSKFTRLGARIPAGVLLEGPPGTGKTLLAKAVAGEAGVPFFSISGSEFVEMFVGVGASRVRDLFDKAKKEAPAIIFIDEIDAVGRQRGAGMGGGHDEREQTLNQLLVEMDGFSGNEGVIVIAATNRSDVLDPALLRPGRFDRRIMVGNPDVKGREAILKVHARNKKFEEGVNLKTIAQQTPGFSGADLENLLNEAALVAARFNHDEITQEDLAEAHDRVIAGVAKRDRVISESQRRTVAYHEAGHTVCGVALNSARKVHKVTIVPRGRAGGYAIMLPKEDMYNLTYDELFEQVVGLLGGRVSEEIFIGAKSTGASDDFKQATNIVRSMVTEYGMSDKLGTVKYSDDDQVFIGRSYGQTQAYSEQVAYEIDLEVRRIMEEAYDKAYEVISNHKEQVTAIAEKLLEVETLEADEIESLFYTGSMPGEADEEEVEAADFETAKAKAEAKHLEKEEKTSSQQEEESTESKVQKALDEGAPLIADDEDNTNTNYESN